jgi:hypothetical protein
MRGARPSRTWGGTVSLVGEPGGGMKWRVVEVIKADGTVRVHEIGGGAATDKYSSWTIGLALAEGKLVLAGLQHHLVWAQTGVHCCRRRQCQRCGAPRPIKDKRYRRLLSLFSTVHVSAPRFEPCRCAVTCRQTLSPISEIIPDRCTPEYGRVIAKMVGSLPYRRARTLLSEFLTARRHSVGGDGAPTYYPRGREAGTGRRYVREGGATDLGGTPIARFPSTAATGGSGAKSPTSQRSWL